MNYLKYLLLVVLPLYYHVFSHLKPSFSIKKYLKTDRNLILSAYSNSYVVGETGVTLSPEGGTTSGGGGGNCSIG